MTVTSERLAGHPEGKKGMSKSGQIRGPARVAKANMGQTDR